MCSPEPTPLAWPGHKMAHRVLSSGEVKSNLSFPLPKMSTVRGSLFSEGDARELAAALKVLSTTVVLPFLSNPRPPLSPATVLARLSHDLTDDSREDWRWWCVKVPTTSMGGEVG